MSGLLKRISTSEHSHQTSRELNSSFHITTPTVDTAVEIDVLKIAYEELVELLANLLLRQLPTTILTRTQVMLLAWHTRNRTRQMESKLVPARQENVGALVNERKMKQQEGKKKTVKSLSPSEPCQFQATASTGCQRWRRCRSPVLGAVLASTVSHPFPTGALRFKPL